MNKGVLDSLINELIQLKRNEMAWERRCTNFYKDDRFKENFWIEKELRLYDEIPLDAIKNGYYEFYCEPIGVNKTFAQTNMFKSKQLPMPHRALIDTIEITCDGAEMISGLVEFIIRDLVWIRAPIHEFPLHLKNGDCLFISHIDHFQLRLRDVKFSLTKQLIDKPKVVRTMLRGREQSPAQ